MYIYDVHTETCTIFSKLHRLHQGYAKLKNTFVCRELPHHAFILCMQVTLKTSCIGEVKLVALQVVESGKTGNSMCIVMLATTAPSTLQECIQSLSGPSPTGSGYQTLSKEGGDVTEQHVLELEER